MAVEENIIRTSGEDAIEVIREYRNDFIDKLLQDHFLIEYLSEQFHRQEMSNTKLQFIKKALLELKTSPVDLSHYSKPILELRRTGSLSISKSTDAYFQSDILRTIQNYL